MNYPKLLNDSYRQSKHIEGIDDFGKLEFLAKYIFGFKTYERIVSALMAEKCLEVCAVISRGSGFKYTLSADNNQWFLIMVNMPFFEGKLLRDWSAGGTWRLLTGDGAFSIQSSGLFYGDKQVPEMNFTRERWLKFIDELIEFTEGREAIPGGSDERMPSK